MVWLRVVYAWFSRGASLKLFRLLPQAFYLWFLFNWFISRLDNTFKPPRSDQGLPLERFFQKSLHLHQFCHHTAIYSFRNWFIYSCFGYRLGTFWPTARSFRIPYRSRNYWTNIVDHLFSGGTHELWNHVMNMKCKQFNCSTDQYLWRVSRLYT